MCCLTLLWKFAFIFNINAYYCMQEVCHSDSSELFQFDSDNMKPVSFLPIRNTIYPHSNVTRFTVPDHLVSWMVKYADYLPEFYESPNIHGKPYADPSIDDVNFHPKWHSLDGNIDRRSFHGAYEIRDKYPLNVAGRTGIAGRGLLGRWAVNHAADPVVTRWKRNIDGTIETNATTAKNILEMIAIQRRDNLEWAIPGGMVDAGEKATATLKREFAEEALNNKNAEDIETFFNEKGVEIYSGYVNDPRNTDNAWIETTAFNFHDDTGDTLTLKLEAGDDAGHVKWLQIDQNVQLYGSHKDIVRKCVERLNAHW